MRALHGDVDEVGVLLGQLVQVRAAAGDVLVAAQRHGPAVRRAPPEGDLLQRRDNTYVRLVCIMKGLERFLHWSAICTFGFPNIERCGRWT